MAWVQLKCCAQTKRLSARVTDLLVSSTEEIIQQQQQKTAFFFLKQFQQILSINYQMYFIVFMWFLCDLIF